FEFSPDGQRVVFRSSSCTAGTGDCLLSIALDGTDLVTLATTDVQRFRVDASGEVTFVQLNAFVPELWTTSIDGSTPALRLATLAWDRGVLDLDVGGGRAVYLADADVRSRYELYSVPLDGSAPP